MIDQDERKLTANNQYMNKCFKRGKWMLYQCMNTTCIEASV